MKLATVISTVRDLPGRSVSEWSGSSVWGRIPGSVVRDKELSVEARLVFAELCLWSGNGKFSVICGQRYLAEVLGIHQQTAGRALKDLAAGGHISIIGSGKKRRRYVLLSPIYRAEFLVKGRGRQVVAARVEDGVIYRREVLAV